MITLVFSVIANLFFGQVTSVSGFGGISGIPIPDFLSRTAHPDRLYFVTLAVALLVYALLRYVARTPFGLALQGIRDDPVRMSSLGYNVTLHRTLAFAFAGFIAAIGGVLFVWWNAQIAPSTIGLSATIDVLVIAVIGGLYRLEGAWLGALVFVLINNYAQDIDLVADRFHTLIGVIFLVIVLVSPNGLIGLWERVTAGPRRHAADGHHPGEGVGRAHTRRLTRYPFLRRRHSMPVARHTGRGAFWLAVTIAVARVRRRRLRSRTTTSSSSTSTAASTPSTSTPAAAAPADAPDPQPAVEPRSGGSGTPIKIAIMSECKGAFGSFDNQNMAGAVAALSQFAGAKPKNPNKPRDGFTGGAIGDHPLKLVGVGCGDDTSDTAIKETRRLMEQLDADVMIGPLSGDESIAVANYAKQHPDKTFVDGSAGAQDTTLKVQAPNFFRFNGDGAQWNAGLGDIAYNKLGWKKAAVVADDYSFGWTSAAGFIAEFCAAGGQVTKRVFPPLNTTDYSSYAQQMPTDVDGTFVAVGGAGLIPFLKAYEQAKGPIDAKKFIGNLFWGTPGQFEQLGPRVSGAYIGGAGTAGDLDTPAAQDYATNIIGKWFKVDPARQGRGLGRAEHVHVRLLPQHLGPDQGPGGGQGRHLRPVQAPGRAGQGGAAGAVRHGQARRRTARPSSRSTTSSCT